MSSFVAKCENGIESKEHTIDNGQGGLDQGQVAGPGPERELPGFDDEYTAGHEKSAAEDAEENVDALVDGRSH